MYFQLTSSEDVKGNLKFFFEDYSLDLYCHWEYGFGQMKIWYFVINTYQEEKRPSSATLYDTTLYLSIH